MTKTSIPINTENISAKGDKQHSLVDPQFLLSVDIPVVELNARTAFQALTSREKLYAHYLSRASWYGGLICLVQTSPESPLIFSLVLKVFGGQDVKELKNLATSNGVSDKEFEELLVYAAGFLTNSANYKSFGDSKFVPSPPPEIFEAVIRVSNAYKTEPEVVEGLWTRVKHEIYSLNDKDKTLGFPDTGVTTYLSGNCTQNDTNLINRYLRSKNMDAYNTRAFKTVRTDGKVHYEIRLASEETSSDPALTHADEVFEGCLFSITRGDYSLLMGLVADNLEKAKEYTSNDLEKAMLSEYIRSFRTGSLDAHKDGSRHWIKNIGPVIETYIGFIETYRDPAGERAEFCGWVAMVNKNQSAKFNALVQAAQTLLPQLPWPNSFEKDEFLRPDFTSLDVLTFCCSGVPAGINIPNYDEIRQNEGFKNVSLGNVISSSYSDERVNFLSDEDQHLIRTYRTKAFEVQVGLHELLGHGSGKLFKTLPDGFNFDVDTVINPLTQRKIEKWYEGSESYDSKFTTISSSYEECRAEAVGLYLSLLPEVLSIFGYEGQEAKDITYVNWLLMMWGVVSTGPESYSQEKKAWLQAHTQARFVILQVLLEAGQGLIKVEETEAGENLLVSLDRSKIVTVGKEAIAAFLLKLQVYKSTGDFVEAEKMYANYSRIPSGSPWTNWRSIALSKIKPRRMFIQCNTEVIENEVVQKNYEVSFAGVIDSWKERFPQQPDVHKILDDLWQKDQPYFTA